MATEKVGGLLEGIESPVAFVIRELMQRELPKYMRSLENRSPDLYYTGAWAFNDESPEAKQLKSKLLAGLVFAGWIGERLTDKFGSQSPRAKIVEMVFGDFPSEVKNFYEREKPVLPAGFKPPTPDKFDELVDNLKSDLKEYFSGWLERIKNGQFIRDFLEFNVGLQVAKSSTRLGPEAMMVLTRVWLNLPRHEQDDLHPALKAINETGELSHWVSLPTDEDRVRFLRAIRDMSKWRFPLSRRQRREIRVIWRNLVDIRLKPQLAEGAAYFKAKNLKLDPNYKDESAWKEEFFSAANLRKDPALYNLLPATDPRRVEYEKKQATKRRWRNILIGAVVVVLLANMTGLTQIIWAGITRNLELIFWPRL